MKAISLRHRVQSRPGVHLASYPMLNGVLSVRVKWSGCDHSPPHSAEVKNA